MPAPVSSERQTFWSYHWGSDQPALASSLRVHTVQDCHADIQSSPQ